MDKIVAPAQSMSFEDMLKVLNLEKISKYMYINDICKGFNEVFAQTLGSSLKDSRKYLDKEFFKNELEKYEERIKSGQPFSDYGTNPHKEIAKYESFQKFKDQIVFDLGSGEFPGHVYSFLSKVGARGYIGVEAFNFEKARKNLEEDAHYYKEKKCFDYDLPFHIIDSDMLTVLKRIPDNSASFITSGIDWAIIKDGEYFKECMDLISQKLHPKGIHIDNWSDFHHKARGNSLVDVMMLDRDLYAISKK